jgi:transposase-like protein
MPVPTPNESGKTAWGRYKCPHCGKEFDHLFVYAIHVVEEHGGRNLSEEKERWAKENVLPWPLKLKGREGEGGE